MIIFYFRKHSLTYIFIGVLNIVALGSFVQQWVKANQEQHVDHKKRYYPNHNYHHYLFKKDKIEQ